jgi:DNA primase
MARFSDESKERVKDAAQIVEIVSAYTDLRQRGKDWWGNCPFHDESTPSFKLNPLENLYYCFGCQASGDVFKFVQEKEGLSFPEAVESLAERYGVELERDEEDPKAEAERRKRARLYELLQRTAEFYERYLWEGEKSEAVKAREYLAERGLKEEVLRQFGVGMAPNRWDSVLLGGQQAGFTVDEIFEAGLLRRNKRGPYDYFRQRIMFPIRDQRGRVIGFGGRAQRPDEKAKYVNSPESRLYRKSAILYGIDVARGPIAKARQAIAVEGYTDVLALHQAGVDNAVAIMGTAMTPEQLLGSGRVTGLAGLTDGGSVVLALDADSAGANAMIRIQKVAAGRGLELLVAEMPADADPADMLKGGDKDGFSRLVKDAVALPVFQIRTALSRGDLASVAGRERVLGEVAPMLKAMGETTVGFDELVREVADKLDTDPALVRERVRTAPDTVDEPGTRSTTSEARGGGPGSGAEGAAAAVRRIEALTPRELRERALLAMCIAEPATGREYMGRLTEDHMTVLGGRALVWVRDHLEDPMAGLPRDDEELVSLVTELVMASKREAVQEGEMELNFMLLEQQRIERGISDAQEAGKDEERARLISERAELRDKIAHAE